MTTEEKLHDLIVFTTFVIKSILKSKIFWLIVLIVAVATIIDFLNFYFNKKCLLHLIYKKIGII